MSFACQVHAQTAAVSSQAAAASNGQVEQIVVTANKRNESLQDVPVAVTAITAATAASVGITDVSSLQTAVPGLQIPRFFNSSTPALRGIGTNFAIGPQESTVAMYIDDVYIASPAATTFSLNNIAQLEVLKGPQGTIFGRNAMAGVVNITTRTPTRTPTMDATIGYANYDTVSGSFYGSTPITDKLLADLAVSGSKQNDGWGKNLYTDKDAFTERDVAARTKLVYTPDDKTDITFAADYTRSRYNSGIAMLPVKGSLFPNGQVYEGFYNVDENVTGFVDTSQGGVSLRATRDLGWAQLINIAAYREVHSFAHGDEDQTTVFSQDLPYHDNRNTFTEELRLVSQGFKNLHWIAGLFYFDDLSDLKLMDGGSAIGPFPLNEQFKQTTKSYAAFGQATYDLPEGFHLTAGARYTYDDLQETGRENIGPGFSDSADNQTHDSAFTYKVNLQKDLAQDLSAYVGYSTGFKGGLYNTQDLHAAPTKPEHLDDLEGGIKSELFDRRLRLNLAAFYYWYKDVQVTTLVAFQGRTSAVTQNAAEAKSYGLEGDIEAHPVEHLTLRGGFELMHARFSSFPDATISVPLATGGNTTVPGDASGNMTPHAPDFSGNFGGDYRFQLGESGTLTFALNAAYTGRFAWDADNRLKQPPYTLVNGSVTWTAPSGHWDVQVWGKNLLSQKYSVYTTANIVGDEQTPGPPLTFGVTVGAHF